MSENCVRVFLWNDDSNGRETILASRACYVTDNEAHVGITIIHDLFGWTFRNSRLLADHCAEDVGTWSTY